MSADDRIPRQPALILVPAVLVVAVCLGARELKLRSDDAVGLFHVVGGHELLVRFLPSVLMIVLAVNLGRRAVAHPAWPALLVSLGVAIGGAAAILLELTAMPARYRIPQTGMLVDPGLALAEHGPPARGVYDWIFLGNFAVAPADLAIWGGVAGILLASACLLWSVRPSGRFGHLPLFSFSATRRGTTKRPARLRGAWLPRKLSADELALRRQRVLGSQSERSSAHLE